MPHMLTLGGVLWVSVMVWSSIAMALDVFTGKATTYGLEEIIGGSCSCRRPPKGVHETMFVAMNKQQYQNSAACSRCLNITGPLNKTVMAYVADFCFECGHGNLDLNPIVWRAVIGGDPRIERITWSFVPCPQPGVVSFCMKEGSNGHWLALQVTNSRDGIKKLSVNGQKANVIGITSFYQVTPDNAPFNTEDLMVEITSNANEKSTHSINSKTDFVGCAMPPTTTGGGHSTVPIDWAKQYAWRSYRHRQRHEL